MIIANKYEIQEKIGSGSFGMIFQGINLRTREKIAIKVEPIHNQTKLLKNESIMYEYLKKVKGIPNVKWFGKDTNNYYMVIPLLGDSLETIKEKYHRLSYPLISGIGIQLIELVESIHEKGLIHRDIKPDNFLFGLEENMQNELYLIDFGFCKSYVNNNNQHIPWKTTTKIIGSANFASIHSHNHEELSRRDDLESIGYILYYLYYRNLEWSSINIFENYSNHNEEIKQLKLRILKKPGLPLFLKLFFENIWKNGFDEKPNYLLLITILREKCYYGS